MARRRRREGQPMHRVLGVPALFSTAYGNVGSSIYYALGVTALYAMGLTPVVLVLTGLLFTMTALSYAEATSMVPEAGGSSSFARRAFNEFASFGAGWGLMLDYIITMAISAFFVPNYLAVFWPVLKQWPWNSIGGIAVIVFLVVVNIVGIKEAARINILLAVLDLGTQVLLMLVGVVLLLKPAILVNQIHLGVAPTWRQLIYGVSIGTVAYTGIETISNMSEEAANPGKDVPRAVKLVLVAVLAVYAGMSLVALSAMPVHANEVPYDPATGMTKALPVVLKDSVGHPNGPYVYAANRSIEVYVTVKKSAGGRGVIDETKPTGKVYRRNGQWYTKLWGSQVSSTYLEDPLQGIVTSIPGELGWLRTILKPWIGILAATILLIGANAGIIGSSRLAYSMGQHRQIPPIMGRLHPRRLTPYVAIGVFGAIACLLIAPGKTALLADLYAFGAMISFTAAHISVIALRVSEPDTPRPYRLPFNIRVRGYSLPLTAIVGGLGTFAVWCVVVATHPLGRIVGLSWMSAGLLMYVVYRRLRGYSLTHTVRRLQLPATAGLDIEYEHILVPMSDTRIANEMMVLACQLAREKESAIDALYVIEVPMDQALDAPLPRERQRGQAVLERAQAIADQFNVRVNPILMTARQPGLAIVETASERRSEVIIMGSRRGRQIGKSRFGRTVDYVLEHATTEVLHNVVPAEYPLHDLPVATPPGGSSESGPSRSNQGPPAGV